MLDASRRLPVWAVGLLLAMASAVPTTSVAAQNPGHHLVVSSRNTSSVLRYDGETGAFVDALVPAGRGGLSTTQEVALGPDGMLYVSGRGNRHILRFDPRDGSFLGPFTRGYELDEPTKATFGPDGDLYVSQWGRERATVARFDGTTGAFVDETDRPLNQGMSHAWDAQGRLYVGTFGDANVVRFSPELTFQDVFAAGAPLAGVVNVRFEDDGSMLIADWNAGAVFRYGPDGAYVATYTDDIRRPEGWAIGPADGVLYVADWEANVIRRYDRETGASLGVFARGGGLLAPNSLVFVPRP